MSYMWNEFNIKTFAAETIVYRDGAYCADLSTLPDGPITKKYDLPVHIIYMGEIAGKCRLNIEISACGQPVFLDVRVKNNLPAFLNIFIKNTGKNSELRGHVFLENDDNLEFDCRAHHASENTGILIQTNIMAGRNSVSKISGAAFIEKNCGECTSDIAFRAMCEPGARMQFIPAQYISAVPKFAGHSAAMHAPTQPQIQFLRGGGLATAEVNDALREAFKSNFTLF